MTETIALFGGTGRTGTHMLTYALEQGYKVRMLARSPEKVQTKHVNLTVIQGDLTNKEALAQVVQGATYVISSVGGPASARRYPKDMMINFVKTLLPILQAESSVKVFLYQAGGFSATPTQPLTFATKLMRWILAPFFGLGPMIRDNEAVIFYLASIVNKSFEVIVTRPGMLEEKDSDLVVVANHDKMASGAITFKALAVFSVKALKDTSLYGTYPYVVPRK